MLDCASEHLPWMSMRRVEDITEALWGTKVSPSTVSELNQKIAGQIEQWRQAPIEGEFAYVFLDGIWLKRSWGGEVKNVSVLVAIGVNQDGFREVLGVAEGTKEDKASWQRFLRYLKDRGLKGVRLVVGDRCLGLVESLGEFFPDAEYQRCVVHFYPISWRLFLPEDWIKDAARRQEARVPVETVHHTKQELALELIAQAQQWSLPVGTVLADSAYGNDFDFRQELRERRLPYAVALEPRTVVWLKDPHVPLPPPKRTGRPRRYPRMADLPPVSSLLEVARKLPAKLWRTVTWRIGTKGPQTSRFALVKAWAAHGWKMQAHPPRIPEWLLIEWPKEDAEPCDYWMLWNPSSESAPSLRSAVHAARGRWKIEQDSNVSPRLFCGAPSSGIFSPMRSGPETNGGPQRSPCLF